MTEDYMELMAYVDRLELYLVGIAALFVISLIATAYLLFFVKEDEDDR